MHQIRFYTLIRLVLLHISYKITPNLIKGYNKCHIIDLISLKYIDYEQIFNLYINLDFG